MTDALLQQRRDARAAADRVQQPGKRLGVGATEPEPDVGQRGTSPARSATGRWPHVPALGMPSLPRDATLSPAAVACPSASSPQGSAGRGGGPGWDADRLHAWPGAGAYSHRTEDTSNVDSHAGVALGAARHGSTGAEDGAEMPADRDDASMAIPTGPPTTSSGPRVRLDATQASQGILDGGWWPRSRDPAAELPELIAGVRAQLGVITRVALNLTAWDSTPSRVAVGDRIVAVGWFHAVNADTITLTRDDHSRVTLLVVPPQASAAAVAVALAMAAEGKDSEQPAAILAASGVTAVDPLAASEARPPSWTGPRSH